MNKLCKTVLMVFALLLASYLLFSKSANAPEDKHAELPMQDGLPDIVEEKRQAIYKAAKNRDYDALAFEAEENISYSFGGSEPGGFIEHLKNPSVNENGEIFDIIATLLELPYGISGEYYSWPEVFLKSAEEWTEADIAQMKELLTDEQIQMYRNFGAYAYYRLGIDKNGKWVYFIAGD